MLSCKDITHVASEGLDKKMPFFKRLQFNMHLAMCKNCRQFIDQIELTVNTLSKMEPNKPDQSYIDDQVNTLMNISQSQHQKKP